MNTFILIETYLKENQQFFVYLIKFRQEHASPLTFNLLKIIKILINIIDKILKIYFIILNILN